MPGINKHYILHIAGHRYFGRQIVQILDTYNARLLHLGFELRQYQAIKAELANRGYKAQIRGLWGFYKAHPLRDKNVVLAEHSVRHGYRNSSYGRTLTQHLGRRDGR